MRSRRSWRNQEKLWRYLTPPVTAPPGTAPHNYTREEIALMPLGTRDRNRMLEEFEKRESKAEDDTNAAETSRS